MALQGGESLWDGAPALPDWQFSPNPGLWYLYEWLVIVGAIVAFMMAWAIGANDVANAFGTSVGAKTIKLWQACIIASVFEFLGSILLGGQVTKTVAGSITSPSFFQTVPEVFAFGMLCALIAGWWWVTTATYLELAVSTTHSIIGAIMGFGLVFGGPTAIVWNQPTSEFPFRAGLTPIVIAWFTSPVLSGCVSGLLFLLNRLFILRRQNSTMLALIALPPLVTLTIFINVFFVLYKGASKELNWADQQCAWVAICVALGCGLCCLPIVIMLHRRFAAASGSQNLPASHQAEPDIARNSSQWAEEVRPKSWPAKALAHLKYSLTVDVHEDLHKDEAVAAMHSAAEVFDPRTEEVYKSLQVFSACCVSFAHGANDVANSIGPYAAIWQVYTTREVSSSAATPRWILAIGGAGIVTGLATYGYNIIRVLGVKMAKMTPSRGYSAELATSLTVAVASVYGLPISTTHCIVGAEVGVGLVEGIREGTNWMLLLKTFIAWVVTLVAAGTMSAAIFAFGSYTPNLTNLATVTQYQNMMTTLMTQQAALMNATNQAHASALGVYDPLLTDVLHDVSGNLTVLGSTQQGLLPSSHLTSLFTYTNALYMSQLVPTVGFNRSTATVSSQKIQVRVLNAPALRVDG